MWNGRSYSIEFPIIINVTTFINSNLFEVKYCSPKTVIQWRLKFFLKKKFLCVFQELDQKPVFKLLSILVKKNLKKFENSKKKNSMHKKCSYFQSWWHILKSALNLTKKLKLFYFWTLKQTLSFWSKMFELKNSHLILFKVFWRRKKSYFLCDFQELDQKP